MDPIVSEINVYIIIILYRGHASTVLLVGAAIHPYTVSFTV